MLPTTVPIAGQAAENQPVPPALVAKQPLAPPASYDLRPRSGTIEARAKRASPVRPAVGPIEVANEPAPALPPSEPEVLHPQPSIPRRSRASARQEPVERPVRVYVFVGLAIGVGIVLAYWLYWSLPFGHG